MSGKCSLNTLSTTARIQPGTLLAEFSLNCNNSNYQTDRSKTYNPCFGFIGRYYVMSSTTPIIFNGGFGSSSSSSFRNFTNWVLHTKYFLVSLLKYSPWVDAKKSLERYFLQHFRLSDFAYSGETTCPHKSSWKPSGFPLRNKSTSIRPNSSRTTHWCCFCFNDRIGIQERTRLIKSYLPTKSWLNVGTWSNLLCHIQAYSSHGWSVAWLSTRVLQW
jgi:hypothetical protein